MIKNVARALLCALLAAGAPSARAATLTVPTEYGSIGWALDSAQAGDTVLVKAGSYGEENIRMKRGVNLVGEGASVTFLTGTTNIETASEAALEGFTITGRTVWVRDSSPVIRRNVIRNSPSAGIYVQGWAWPTIYQNAIYDNAGGGIQNNGMATIVNNTIVGNVIGYALSASGSGFLTMNNIVVNNYYGYYGGAVAGEGWNDAWSNQWSDYRGGAGPGDFSADPLFVHAPKLTVVAYEFPLGPGGYDTARVQLDYTSRILVGDHVEIGYDKVDRVVTEVTLEASWSGVTNVRFSPPLPQAGGATALHDWGDSADFTYDLALAAGSPCIDAGNPDPAFDDADGTRNDVGATGGTAIPAVWEGVPPATPGAVAAAAGDAEITLTWTLPADGDLQGVLVVRREGAAVEEGPVTPNVYYTFPEQWWQSGFGDARVIYIGGATTFTDADLLPGVEYHYAVYAFDRFNNYSAPGRASATPFHAARTLVVDAAGAGDFSTIAAAVAAAKPSDTVLVRAGTYAEAVTVKNGVAIVGESRDAVIVAKPADSWTVFSATGVPHGSIESLTIQGPGTFDESSAGVWLTTNSSVDVRDVAVKGFNLGVANYGGGFPAVRTMVVESCLFEGNGTALALRSGAQVNVRMNTFRNNPGVAVYVRGSSLSELVSNVLEDNGYAINVYESAPLIVGNTLARNLSGVQLAWDSHPLIARNVITETVYSGITAVSGSSPTIRNNVIARGQGDALWLFLDWPRVWNNTIVDNGGNGITIQYGAYADTRNNVIAFNRGWGTWAGEDYYLGTPALYYNAVFGNVLGNTSPATPVYEGNVFVDPLLRDRAAGDYHLAVGSPCVDAGDPAEAFRDANGTRNDIGAFGGPDALPRDVPTIPEQVETIGGTIVVLPDYAFKGADAGRKATLELKLEEVLLLIQEAEAAANPADRRAYLETALAKLQKDLLAKMDGSFGGNPKNDWIVTPEAQALVHPLLLQLIGEVQALLASTPA